MKKIDLTEYTDFICEKITELLAINSPTGYTEEAAHWVQQQFQALGYDARITNKGGILISFGGNDKDNGLLIEAHTDTLGGMVAEIKSDGRLRVTNLGGINANAIETENVTIITKDDKRYEGTFQLIDASLHVNGKFGETKRDFDSCEVVIDEDVASKEDVEKLGIANGDIICFDTRTHITKSGYIKSRFLDDKLSVGIILAFAKYMHDKKITPSRAIYSHITVFEEVGHGGAGNVPTGCTEAISVDMGCVGQGLECTERKVSICAKDSGGPYSYPVVSGLISAAKEAGVDYAVDVYPHYGSDVEASLSAGHDVRHGLIGPGVYASHGYERSHRDGAENALRLLLAYCLK